MSEALQQMYDAVKKVLAPKLGQEILQVSINPDSTDVEITGFYRTAIEGGAYRLKDDGQGWDVEVAVMQQEK